jgi:hypothetical protein
MGKDYALLTSAGVEAYLDLKNWLIARFPYARILQMTGSTAIPRSRQNLLIERWSSRVARKGDRRNESIRLSCMRDPRLVETSKRRHAPLEG